MARETANMHFVDHGLGEGSLEWHVPFPVVGTWIGHHALHRLGGIVAGAERCSAVVSIRYRHREAVRIEEDLFAVEKLPLLRRKRPVCTVCVDLARPAIRHERVPVVVGSMTVGSERNDPRGLWSILPIEKQKL